MNLPTPPPDEISSRQRVLLALDHRPTDRVPMTFAYAGIERPVQDALARYLGLASPDDVSAHHDSYEDIALVGPNFRGADPDYRGPVVWRSAGAYDDIWGCRWEPLDPETGPYDISHQPFAEAKDPSDLDRHTWPAADWWDWDAIAERIAHARDRKDYALCMHSGNLWERAWWMRGFENSLFDMIENPDFHHALMERVTMFYLDVTKRILDIADGAIDLAFTADDIGGQDGLLLSLAMWEQNIKPYHQRLTKLIHDFGVKVVYHSDGNVMPAVAGLIDQGVDVLQALQFSARGMDPVALKDTYGDRLCFQGGISVQTTLPFGTVEDVRREVRDRIRVLGRSGGYILSPSHTIMPGTPPENVIAMLETAASTPVPAG